MDLIKIKLNELEEFYKSSVFQSFSVKPISPLRVKSYIENPRANANDTVLYMYVENGELIAFRSILSDCVENIHFGWCSGNWVNPAFRGHKLSVKLLNEVLKDWTNGLMFTNYAPTSEHCYLRTQQFNILKKRVGLRFYLYPDFSEIYKERKSYLKPILPLLSAAAWGISFLKSFSLPTDTAQFVELDELDEDCRKFLQNSPQTFFNRKEAELDWIVNYPWVISDEYKDFVYPFSYSGIHYSLKIVKVFDKNHFVGFFIYTIVNDKMKLIYHFVKIDKMNLMVDAVSVLAHKNKIAFLSILEPSLAKLFQEKSRCFAFSKQIGSHIYSSLGIENTQNLTVFDGDGDNGFT